MDFDLTDLQLAWQQKAQSLGRDLAGDVSAAGVVMGAARVGLLDPRIDLLSAAVAVEALAEESAAAAVALALHTGVLLGTSDQAWFAALVSGEVVGAIGLSSDEIPAEQSGHLTGRASWVAPLTDHGVAVMGARTSSSGLIACLVSLDGRGVHQERVETAGLAGVVCGHVSLDDAEYTDVGSPLPVMTRVRVLLAAAGLGMGRRALREALLAAKGHTGHGAGGEQTVQGLLADAATELDAAMLLTWKAASAARLSLADASMAKLASTEATQRAVARATQVVGADTFRSGHIVEELAQDVRALELFAGRTEALREAVAGEILP